MELNVGDRVIVNKNTFYRRVIGKKGYIFCKHSYDSSYYGVRFDDFKGHTLDGILDTNDGFWVEKDAVEIFKNSNKDIY